MKRVAEGAPWWFLGAEYRASDREIVVRTRGTDPETDELHLTMTPSECRVMREVLNRLIEQDEKAERVIDIIADAPGTINGQI